MGQDSLDNIIRNTLSNHQVPVDTDMIWTGILQKQRSKRKYFLLYTLVVFLLMAACALTYKLFKTEFNNKTVHSPQEDSRKPLEYNLTTKTTDFSTDKNLDNVASSVTTDNANEISIVPDNTNATDNPSPLNANINKLEGISLSKDVIRNSNSEHASNKISSDKLPLTPGDRLKSTMTSPQGIGTTEQSGVLESNMFPVGDIANNYAHDRNTSITNTLASRQIYMPITDRLKLFPGMKLSNTNDCPRFNKKPARVFVEAYSLLDYSMQKLGSDIETENYLSERKASQSYRPGYRAGVQFKYLFNNGLFVKSGLEYSEAREKFRYRKETVTTEILPNQVINIHIDMNGDTTITLGNAPVTTIETRNWRVKNSYKTLGIPLSLGYQIENRRWFYALEAGVVYNFMFDFNGMLLDETLEPVDGENYFSNNSHWNYNLAVTAGYRIKPNLSFIIRAGYRNMFSNINSDINLISQRFALVGTGIGLEYEF